MIGYYVIKFGTIFLNYCYNSTISLCDVTKNDMLELFWTIKVWFIYCKYVYTTEVV